MCAQPGNFKRVWLVLLLAATTGCTTPHSPARAYGGTADPGLRWPPAPAESRVHWLGEARRPSDLGARRSAGVRLLNLVTGGDRGDEPWIRPCGLAVDEAGNPCMTDSEAGMVGFQDLVTGRFHRWTRLGKTDLLLPVAVAKHGQLLWVADTALARIIAFGLDGRIRYELGPPLQRPCGLAWMGDRLLVVDSATHRVHAYAEDGRPLGATGERGEAAGQFNFPTHLATDGSGGVWVTDTMNFRVQHLDAALRPIGLVGRMGNGGGHLSRPKGVAIAPDGNLLVVDALFDNVQIFDPAGRFLLHWGNHGGTPGEFWLPSGIAVSSDGIVYVADAFNRRIQVFRLAGGP